MISPTVALCLGNEGNPLLKECCSARWEMEVKRIVGRGNHAKQAWVESLQFIDRGADKVGDQTEVDGIIDRYGVSEDGRVEVDLVKAVLLRVIGDDDGSQNFGDVVLRFAG